MNSLKVLLQVGERTSLYILDCLFSVLVVGTLVVFVWRGMWVLLDLFLFPEDEVLSAWSSLVRIAWMEQLSYPFTSYSGKMQFHLSISQHAALAINYTYTVSVKLWSLYFFSLQVVGYSIVAIAFLMQPAMRWLCDRLSATPRLLVADLFLLFSLVSTINVWRGLWNLLNIYLLPGK